MNTTAQPDPGAAVQRLRARAVQNIPTGSRWRHSQTGHFYHVINLSVEEGTYDIVVNYADMEKGWQWTCPLSTWQQKVTLVDGTTAPRFVLVEAPS